MIGVAGALVASSFRLLERLPAQLSRRLEGAREVAWSVYAACSAELKSLGNTASVTHGATLSEDAQAEMEASKSPSNSSSKVFTFLRTAFSPRGSSIQEKPPPTSFAVATLILALLTLFLLINLRDHWRNDRSSNSRSHSTTQHIESETEEHRDQHGDADLPAGQVEQHQNPSVPEHQQQSLTPGVDRNAPNDRAGATTRAQGQQHAHHANAPAATHEQNKDDEEIDVSEPTPSGRKTRRRTKARRDFTEGEATSRPRTRRQAAFDEAAE